MTVEWYDPAVKLPDEEAECLLIPHDNSSLITLPVFGPIAWNVKQQAWLDLFREPEAGTIIYPKQVGCWTLWDPIKPPEGLPTPLEEPAT